LGVFPALTQQVMSLLSVSSFSYNQIPLSSLLVPLPQPPTSINGKKKKKLGFINPETRAVNKRGKRVVKAVCVCLCV
jgi:hypothetical protein